MWFIVYDEDSLRHAFPPVDKQAVEVVSTPLARTGLWGYENPASPIYQAPILAGNEPAVKSGGGRHSPQDV
jgi:hypothetical protein